MFQLLINPIPILLIIGTAFGVLLHDSQIDRAMVTAVTIPVTTSVYGPSEATIKLSDVQPHSEQVSATENIRNLNDSQPTIQPRANDDKRYVVQKKASFQVAGSDYSWPSI